MAATFIVTVTGKMYDLYGSSSPRTYTSYFVFDMPGEGVSPTPRDDDLGDLSYLYLVRNVGFSSELLSDVGLVSPFNGSSKAYDENSKYDAVVSFDKSYAYLTAYADLGSGNNVNYWLAVHHEQDMTGKSLSEYFTPDAEEPYSFSESEISWPNFTAYSGPVTVTVSQIAVPEPASWTMMIGGFAIAGGAVRRRSYRLKVSLA
jgi:hypothetical protein